MNFWKNIDNLILILLILSTNNCLKNCWLAWWYRYHQADQWSGVEFSSTQFLASAWVYWEHLFQEINPVFPKDFAHILSSLKTFSVASHSLFTTEYLVILNPTLLVGKSHIRCFNSTFVMFYSNVKLKPNYVMSCITK